MIYVSMVLTERRLLYKTAMLYLPTTLLQPGMTLACDIPNPVCDGICFEKGDVLTSLCVNNIDAMGLAGAYIQSRFTTDVVIKDCMGAIATTQSLTFLRHVFSNRENIPVFRRDVEVLLTDVLNKITTSSSLLSNLHSLNGYDNYTYGHSLRVAILSILIAIRLGLNRVELWEVGMSGLLHDIGKTNVTTAIVNKNGKLSNSEYDVIKQHPEVGYEYLKEFFFFNDAVCEGVRYHHEHYDGRGYPEGLAGKNIPLYARILCVADVYDALTTRRPYREAWFPCHAISQMKKDFKMFDPMILSTLEDVTMPYPEGTIVILNTGELAAVTHCNVIVKDRPTIRTLSAECSRVIDLSKVSRSEVSIVDIGYTDNRIQKILRKE